MFIPFSGSGWVSCLLGDEGYAIRPDDTIVYKRSEYTGAELQGVNLLKKMYYWRSNNLCYCFGN